MVVVARFVVVGERNRKETVGGGESATILDWVCWVRGILTAAVAMAVVIVVVVVTAVALVLELLVA